MEAEDESTETSTLVCPFESIARHITPGCVIEAKEDVLMKSEPVRERMPDATIV